MPRSLIRAPNHNRRNSLGWLATAWMEFFCRHGRGAMRGRPVEHGDEYTGFIVDCYALGDSPSNRHMLYDSAFLSRPKGCDKSGQGSRFCEFEAFGPARVTGWARGGEVYEDPWGFGFRYEYAPGEPMGAPVETPVIRCLATEEDQSGNVYDSIYFNLTDERCPLSFVPGVDAGLTRILLPNGGEIIPSTASAASKDGGLETFCVLDESHLMTTRELREMYDTVTRNLRKQKGTVGTWYLETTTMFAPGSGSVAEATFGEAQALIEGRKKRGRHRLLYDHRWGDCDDITNEDTLRGALRDAFGDAMAWQDEDGLVDEFYDTRKDEADSRRYYLNAQTSPKDAWVEAHRWAACGRPDLALRRGDVITLGGDGSYNDDATAIVATRVADGHQELLGCWEKPENAGDDWQVDGTAVDACMHHAMTSYVVVGCYWDPAHWQDYLDRWHQEWAHLMKVKATAHRPLEWWTNRPRFIVAALQRYHQAIMQKTLSYTPSVDRTGRQAELAATLTRHVLNARRAPMRLGLQIRKESPHSMKKIDGCMAAVLSWEARCDALAAGHGQPVPFEMPKRIR